MAYTVHQAKTHFSRLLKEAEEGKEVVVMRGKKPVARIVPIGPDTESSSSRRFLAGAYRGKVHSQEGAFDPMTDEELVAAGFGFMLDAPLVPAPDGPTNK